MTLNFDYSKEPRRDIAFVDMKSFYASCECIMQNLNPLKACLAVMSNADNSEGLILASSPVFKWAFGSHNVGRSRDLPFDVRTRRFNWRKWNREHRNYFTGEVEAPNPQYVQFIEYWAKQTIFTPPTMMQYIKTNGIIQKALHEEMTSSDEIWWYSIDEGFLDLTSVLNYHTTDKSLSSAQKLDLVSRKMQRVIYDVTQKYFDSQYGIVSTVGMSNSNPLLAKLALDNYAKNERTMRALINYENVPSKVWTIRNLTDFWGIGHKIERRLKKLGIHSVYDLANTSPEKLKREFGIIGVELYCHANGIDESNVKKPYQSKSKSVSNSTTLPCDYTQRGSILMVLGELAEQVAIRLRKIHQEATSVSLYVGYSIQENKTSIHVSKKVEPTNNTKELKEAILNLFLNKYEEGAVRRLGIAYSDFISEEYHLINLFDTEADYIRQEKEEKFQEAVDTIREQFGFTSIVPLSALKEGSRMIARSKQIGGHSAGGLDGLQ